MEVQLLGEKTNSRKKLVEAASRLFQLKGYHATGLNEILQESGAPKGSLYYYFPKGKEALALAAIDLASGIIADKVRTGLGSFSEAIPAIEHTIQEMVDALKADGQLQNMSLSLLALETYLSSETLRDACAASFAKLKALYAGKLLEAGFSRQAAVELGSVLQSMIEGAITISVTQKDTAPLEAVIHRIPILLGQRL